MVSPWRCAYHTSTDFPAEDNEDAPRRARTRGKLDPMSNERGRYGPRPHSGAPPWLPPHIGAESPPGRSKLPWLLGGAALVAVGVAVANAYAKRPRPQLSEHEREVRAWEAEFPGLPWYQDQVKSSQQLDMWERARDYWETTH